MYFYFLEQVRKDNKTCEWFWEGWRQHNEIKEDHEEDTPINGDRPQIGMTSTLDRVLWREKPL